VNRVNRLCSHFIAVIANANFCLQLKWWCDWAQVENFWGTSNS